MKKVLFLLFPLFLMGQNLSYPDTMYYKSGKIFPCFVLELNKDLVKAVYGNEITGSAGFPLIDKVVIDGMGVVYRSKTGFTTKIDSIANYLKTRNKIREKKLKERAERLKVREKIKEEKKIPQPGKNVQKGGKWSFGLLYIPNYSEKIYRLSSYNYYGYNVTLLTDPVKKSLIKTQFTYRIFPRLRIVFNFAYTKLFSKNRWEKHNENLPGGGYYDYGYIKTNDLKIIIGNLGIKYFLSPIRIKKVSPYVLASIGKQWAFSNFKYKDLFVDQNTQPKIESNINTYLEGLNSPLILDLGFGAEYFVNESFSVNSRLFFSYSAKHSTFDYRNNNTDEITSVIKETKNSEVLTEIGFGLNFYFN
ncbi:MAG: hypothetical protein GXO77_07930 [Calditrichaeota bacterium]|nr:hypothetical protein [Calditrichota bacterium]